MALMAGCWLASCGGLFRTSAIPEHYFDGRTAFLEWTWLAFQLVLDKRKIQFIDSRTFRVNDSPQSLSRSNAALFGQVRVLSDMLRYRVPPAIRGELRRKRASALHSVAYHQVRSGNLGSAWAFHLASMAGGGWRYLSFTRHLLFGSLNSKAID